MTGRWGRGGGGGDDALRVPGPELSHLVWLPALPWASVSALWQAFALPLCEALGSIPVM